jgi:hypothetical protein
MLDTPRVQLAGPVLFLKATAKKQVWIPQFTKKNGQVVGGHYAMVHVADDHDHHKVASGAGTYSQKKAHASLKDEPGFHDLPPEEQAALVMHHATQIQDAESQAARIATLRKKLLAGEKPTPGEWKAFHAAPQEKRNAVTEAVHAAGKGALMDSEYAAWAANQPPANEKEPDKAAAPAAKEEPKAEPEKPASAQQASGLAVPEFQEGKTTTGVKKYYDGLASKIVAMAAAGDVAGLNAMPQPEKGSWSGKTANSKKLLALHAAAVEHAKGGTKPAPAAPVPESASEKLAAAAQAKLDAEEQLHDALADAGIPATNDPKKGLLLSKYHGGFPNTYANKTQADNAAAKLQSMGFSAKVIGLHPFLVQITGKKATAAEAAPKEGDTKEGAGGTLVLKDGHWVLQAAVGASSWSFLKQSLDGPMTMKEAAAAWQMANPGKDAELSSALVDMGFLEVAKDMGIYQPPGAAQAPAVSLPSNVEMPKKPKVTGWYQYNDDVEQMLQEGNQADLKKLIDVFIVDGEEPHPQGNAGKVLAYAKQALAYLEMQPGDDLAHDAKVAAANAEPVDAKALQQLVDAFHDAKVPESNTNAKAFNPKVDAIITALQAGDKAALLAMSYGTNTYGKKAAKLANEALEFLGSRHQVAPGQKAGQHPTLKVVSVKMSESVPAAAESAPAPVAAASSPEPTPASVPPAAPVPPAMDALSPSKQDVLATAIHNVNSKNIAALEGQAQAMEGLLGFAPIHAYVTQAIAHLNAEMGGAVAPDTSAAPGAIGLDASEIKHASKWADKDVIEHANGLAMAGDLQNLQDLAQHELDHDKVANFNHINDLVSKLTVKQKQAADKAAGTAVAPSEQAGAWYEPPAKIAGKIAVQEMMEAAKKGDLSGLTNLLHTAWEDGEQAAHSYGTKLKEHLEQQKAAAPEGPKDGDTKQGADGMLVFQNGRWHKMGTDPKVLKQKAASVPVPKLSGQHSIKMGKTMKALKALAEAQGAAGLEKIVKVMPDGKIKILKGEGNPNGWIALSPTQKTHGANALAMAAYANALLGAMAGTKGASVPPDAPAAPAAAAPEASAAPVQTIAPVQTEKVGKVTAMVADKWEQTGLQKGSNPGGRFKDAKGQEWYCKFPSDPDTVKNELLAAKFYQMLGVDVPELRLVKRDGKLGIASKWVDGLTKGDAAALATAEGAHKGFVFDAWLANWDVIGLANDNMLLKDGKAVRVDVGGSLIYRAQGGKKGDAFGESVTELDTLLDPVKNSNSAAVFGKITPADLNAGGAVLAKMHPNQIDKLCRTFGPGTRVEQEALAAKLVARRAFILKKLGVEDPWDAPAPDITKLQVNPADLPPPIDFNNYPGKGGGLSSKKHINDQNTVDDAALIEFAKQGNLKALQDYHYDAYDKETGAYIGKKPIGEHPSKDIKNHWASMCDLLTAIAHPPVEGLDLPPIGGGSIEEVSEAAGYIKPGENIKTISSDKVIGFWMKLGHVGAEAVADLVPAKSSFLKTDFVAKAKKWYQGVSTATKALVNSIQDSGAANRFWNNGNTQISLSSNGHTYSGGAQTLASTIYNEAFEFDEGETVGRWMNLPDTMKQQLLKEGAGLVFQNADSMCTSIFKNWGDNAKFGSGAFLNIRFAKGAKAMASLGSGRFSSSSTNAEGEYVHTGGGEMEVTTLMGQRFVVLGVKKGNASSPDGITLDLLALPPHDGYLADMGGMAQMGKSLLIFRDATDALRRRVVVFINPIARAI